MGSNPESSSLFSKEKLISPLAGFAKEMLQSLRGDAEKKLDGKEKKLDKVIASLEEIQHVFGDKTDPEAEQVDSGLSGEQARSFLNLVRSIFSLDPVPEEEPVDLERDLVVAKDQTPVLKLPEREVHFLDLDFSQFKDKGDRLVKTALSSIGMQDSLGAKSCWDWIHNIYKAAGLKEGPAVFANSHYGSIGSLDYKAVLPGAWLYIHNGNKWDKFGDHSVVFSRWIDEDKHIAEVMSFPGAGVSKPKPRIHTVDFSKEPITRISLPV